MTTIYNVSTLNATTIEAGTIWATNIRYIGDTNGSYSLNTLGDYVYNELNDVKFMSTITTYMNTRPYPNDTYSVKRIMPILPQSPDTPVNASDLTTKVYVDTQVSTLKSVTNTSLSTLSTSFNNLSTRLTTDLAQTNTNLNNASSRLTSGLATLTSRITTDVNGLTLTTGELQTYGINVSTRLTSELVRISLQSFNDAASMNARVTTEVSNLSSRISTLTSETNTSILNVSSRLTSTVEQTTTVIENVSVRVSSLLNLSTNLASVSSRVAAMNATLLNITGAADVSNFTNQLTALNDRITVNTSNSSDLGIRFDAFTQVVNTSFASTVTQASESLITTLNTSLSLLNASISSTNALVNTSFASINTSLTTLNNSISQENASVNASFANLVNRMDSTNTTVNASFTSLATGISQLNTSVNASFTSLATGISQLNTSVNTSFTSLATSVSQVNASVNNVSFNLNQLSSRIDTQNTVKLVCNDISCNQIFCTQVFTTSDLNKKNNIVSCDLGMDFMDTLRPVSFTYTDNPDKVFYGFVAQEVKAALELDDKVPERYGLWTEEQDTQFLSLQELISPLVKSLQEVHARLRQVEAQLETR
jgi:hypothetical protein